MTLNHYITKNYENKPELLTMAKQTQTKPIEETERFRRGATASQRVSDFSIFSQHIEEVLHIFRQRSFEFHYFVGGWVFEFEGAGM